MASGIDETKPVSGSATTSSVRSNFSAAKDEINELHRITEDSVTATGTVDALVADFTNDVTLAEGVTVCVKATGANTSTTPTLNVDGTGAVTIVKGNGEALIAGDIKGNRHYCIFRYDAANTVWVLMNPAIDIAKSSDVDHDATINFVANEHINHGSVSITAGTGLTGGGDLTATRTLDLDINGLTTATGPDAGADFVPFYDTSGAVIRKILMDGLFIAEEDQSQDGYIEFTNGIIVQWGRTTGVPVTSTKTVTLPKAYPNNHFITIPNVESGGDTISAVQVDSRTLTTF